MAYVFDWISLIITASKWQTSEMSWHLGTLNLLGKRWQCHSPKRSVHGIHGSTRMPMPFSS